MFDGEVFGQQMVEVVKAYVDRATAPLVSRITELEAREIPEAAKGEKGDRGPEGPEGAKGPDGASGANGLDGKDGTGVADALIDKDGNLVLTLTDGRTKSLGQVNGEDGKDGESLTLDDFDIEQTDERTLLFKFTKGDFMHSFEFAFPVAIYRGVFSEGHEYEKGDMSTWGGSLWHCDEPTKEKPGSGPWTLVAKKGRDGKGAA